MNINSPISNFQFPINFQFINFKIRNSKPTGNWQLVTGNSPGFTLIELLIVIVIVGILSVGTFIAIDPVDRVNFANDAKAQTALGAVARAAESYSTTHENLYPPNIGAMVSSGQFKSVPQMPQGYTLSYLVPSATPACTSEGDLDCTKFVVYAQLKSKKYTSNPYQLFESTNGKTCQLATEPTIDTTCP